MADISEIRRAKSERDSLRAQLTDLVDSDLTSDQQAEIGRLKTMLEEACDIAEKVATDSGDKADIARLRKAAR